MTKNSICYSFRRIIPILALATGTIACVPKPPSSDYSLPPPELKVLPKVQEVNIEQLAKIESADDAKKLIANALTRFFDIVGYANHRVGLFHSGVGHFPSYAMANMETTSTTKQKMIPQPMGTLRCSEQSDSSSKQVIPPHTVVSIWDDRDNNKESSAEDRYYQYFNDCTEASTNETVDGLITYFGSQGFDVMRGDESWKEMDVLIDMQVIDALGNTVLIKDALFSLKQDGDVQSFDIRPADGAAYATFAFFEPSVKDKDDKIIDGGRYVFFLNHAKLSYDSKEDIETVNFHGHYYDSALSGSVDINGAVDNDLTFEKAFYSFHSSSSSSASNEHAALKSGQFNITAANGVNVEFATTSNAGEIQIKYNNETLTSMFHELIDEKSLMLIAID